MKVSALQDRQEFKWTVLFFKNFAASELRLAAFVFPEH